MASSVSWPPFCQEASISDFERVVERLKYITGRPLPELTRPIDRSFGSEIFSLEYFYLDCSFDTGKMPVIDVGLQFYLGILNSTDISSRCDSKISLVTAFSSS